MWVVQWNAGEGSRLRVFDCPADANGFIKLCQRHGHQTFYWRLDRVTTKRQ